MIVEQCVILDSIGWNKSVRITWKKDNMYRMTAATRIANTNRKSIKNWCLMYFDYWLSIIKQYHQRTSLLTPPPPPITTNNTAATRPLPIKRALHTDKLCILAVYQRKYTNLSTFFVSIITHYRDGKYWYWYWLIGYRSNNRTANCKFKCDHK